MTDIAFSDPAISKAVLCTHLCEFKLLFHVADDRLAGFTAESARHQLGSHFTCSGHSTADADQLTDLIHLEIANRVDQRHIVEGNVEITGYQCRIGART